MNAISSQSQFAIRSNSRYGSNTPYGQNKFPASKPAITGDVKAIAQIVGSGSFDLSNRVRNADDQHAKITATAQTVIVKLKASADRLRPASTKPDYNLSRVAYVVLQEWEGFVEEIYSDKVRTRLIDVHSSELESAFADIPIDEFSEGDREKMRVGSIFRWAIGIEKTGKTQKRISQVILRDLPAWNKAEIQSAKDEGESLGAKLRSLSNEDEPSQTR